MFLRQGSWSQSDNPAHGFKPQSFSSIYLYKVSSLSEAGSCITDVYIRDLERCEKCVNVKQKVIEERGERTEVSQTYWQRSNLKIPQNGETNGFPVRE